MERVADLTEEVRKGAAAREIAQLIYLKSKRTSAAEQLAEARRFTGSGRVHALVKAAIESGGAGASEWGTELATFDRLAREWIALVDSRTILGQLRAVRVPFATKTATESGMTASFGHTLPVGSLSFTATSALERLSLGVITVFTDELMRTWRPGSAENINAVLTRSVARGLDSALLDPDISATAGENPASLLSGVSPSGDLTNTTAGALSDVQTLIQSLVDAGSDLQSALFVCHPRTALALSVLNTSGVFTFPNVTPTGGSILGIPLATSVSAVRSGSPTEKLFALLDGARVMVADDGEADFNVSRIATLQMDDSPTMDVTGTPTATTGVSMFQTESVAVKVIRRINFARAHASACAWLTSAF